MEIVSFAGPFRPRVVTMGWGVAIWALAGAALGAVLSFALNSFGLSLIDWLRQDFLSGGASSMAAWSALGGVTGGFLGLIYRYTR